MPHPTIRLTRNCGVAATLALAAAGCATQQFEPIVPSDGIGMVSSRDLAPEQYTAIGEMTGLSCARDAWSYESPSERNAIIELQRKAYAAGADGLLDPQCRTSEGADWVNNCWQSVECRGIAIKFTPGSGGSGGPRVASGSGFVVTQAGHVLTNAHVVAGCKSATGQLPSGRFALTIVNVDESNDLAVLQADVPLPAAASFRDGPSVRAGDDVIAVGFPLQHVLANQANITTGTVSALAGIGNDARHMQVTTPIQPGNSGGPLLDRSGNVVGVTVSALGAEFTYATAGALPENVNFAVKAEIVRTYLESRGIGYASRASNQPVAVADIGESAKAFTVFITCSPE